MPSYARQWPPPPASMLSAFRGCRRRSSCAAIMIACLRMRSPLVTLHIPVPPWRRTLRWHRTFRLTTRHSDEWRGILKGYSHMQRIGIVIPTPQELAPLLADLGAELAPVTDIWPRWRAVVGQA